MDLLVAVASEKQLVAKCLARIKYQGPVELLSMWACLFGDPDAAGVVATKGLQWLLQNAEALKKVRRAYEQQHNITPHMAVLLKRYVHKADT